MAGKGHTGMLTPGNAAAVVTARLRRADGALCGPAAATGLNGDPAALYGSDRATKALRGD